MRKISSSLQGKKLYIIVLAFITIALSSCNINRFVPEGQYLVQKNTVVIHENGEGLSKSKLSSYIALKPYKTNLQTNIPFWIYYHTEKYPKSKFWKWMNKNFGKEPIYYEQAEANRSTEQMMRYLNQAGHFNSTVKSSVALKKKRARVTYDVFPTPPYHISKFNYYIGDTLLERYIMRGKDDFPIKEGDIYNESQLNDMREIITDRLKNSGYYFFNRSNIRYEVDSNFMNRTMVVNMKVEKNELSHKQYRINNISVYPNYSIFRANEPPSDSATLSINVGRRQTPNTIDFYYYGKPRVRPSTFSRSILIYEGYPYNLRSVTNTYKALSNFRLFSNVNITFDTIPNDTLNLLDCKITMRQNDGHSFTVQAEGTNSDGDLGIKGSLSYNNFNLFRGAEIFQISLRGGLEAQTIFKDDESDAKRVFNTTEFGISTSIQFPRFLSFIPLRNFARDYQPTTVLSLGFSSQSRYYYSRYITSASFSYDWKTNYNLRQTFSPISLNSVKIDNIDSVFQKYLDAETNQRKKDQYSNHLIFGAKYSFIYNTQKINQEGSFFYLRSDIESSGNLLSLFNNTQLITTEEDGHHEIFGIRYAQYIRTSFDIRQHLYLGRDSWIVLRQFIGLGVPYGNSKDLPFERSFYAGGANGLRGWSYRAVGPGSYHSTTDDMERIGDIQLELNGELRFPIYNIFNGAIFADAGNIWTYYPNSSMPGSEFRFDNFYKQIAFDAGFGLRIDVSFLILRLDLAYALRNPYPNDNGNYWRVFESPLRNIRLQWGIGYPF